MEVKKDYRPALIEFDVAPDGTNVPECLGTFKTDEEALKHMLTFTTTNQALTVNRYMDNIERAELRKKYNSLLEDQLPDLEQKLRDAVEEFNDAKKRKEDATEAVSAYTNEAKMLAQKVKRGLMEMRLDDKYTWRMPYKNRFYFFTYIDKQIRLVKIADMTQFEQTELFSQGKINEEVFDNGAVKTKSKSK
jgi:predicted ribosome quality control (RQC) complex YloA/Tae2 family protein